MRYGSICSGIEAATAAWHTLGWTPAWFAEIDPFCSAVLAHHYPGVPNHGDFTRLLDPAHPVHAEPPLDVLVGGTPCQDFSTAGLRAGIEGERGNLTLDFCRLVGVLRPRWVVWENVPGVLSSDGGRAMGAFTGALAELGYGFAWRVLDAQYFGLAQRRKRVFVVGRAGGDWERAGEVLLEPEGLRGDPPARRQACEVSPSDARGRAARGGGGRRGDAGGGRGDGLSGQGQAGEAWCYAIQDVRQISKRQNGRGWNDEGTSFTLDRHSREEAEVAACLNVWDERHSPPKHIAVERRIEHEPAFAFQARIARNGRGQPEHICPTLNGASSGATSDMRPCVVRFDGAREGGNAPAVAFNGYQRTEGGVTWPLGASDGRKVEVGIRQGLSVRRLTPRECERLQGFPDDWTAIPGAKDAPRYKAIGNSMAVPVMRWIGERIQLCDAMRRAA